MFAKDRFIVGSDSDIRAGVPLFESALVGKWSRYPLNREVRRAPGRSVARDFYLTYEGTERVVRLWHERPDRWRE